MNINSKMVLSTKDSGAGQLDTVVASKFGLTALVMRVSGKTIRLMEKESSGMLTVMSSMENGKMIRQMDMAYILMLMGLNTRVIGKMIYNMDMV